SFYTSIIATITFPRFLIYTPTIFFFKDTPTTEIYTLSLHDALPIYRAPSLPRGSADPRSTPERAVVPFSTEIVGGSRDGRKARRSEEHTSELQSQSNLVCRLLLEKKKKTKLPPSLNERN